MLIRQSQGTFIRITPNYGYIINQATRLDRVYDASGAIFLKQISRTTRSLNDMIDSVCEYFQDGVKRNVIRADFIEFIKELEIDKFIVSGNSIEELNNKDIPFSYSNSMASLVADNYRQQGISQEGIEDTQDFFLNTIKTAPVIQNLQFELSSRCNERCIHCYIPNKKKDTGIDMPLSKVKEIIDEFAELGGLSVTLSGGEVLLHNNVREIINYCRKKDLKISILSNLIILSDDLIPVLQEANIAIIQVSLYSMDENIHDSITQVKGSWRRTKNAIDKLVGADIPVQISCPLMKANKEGYADVTRYARSLKIKCQTDYIMMAQADLNTSNLANRLSVEECRKVIRDIVLNDFDYREKTLTQIPPSEEMLFDFENFKKQPVCGVGFDNCCIAANGDVYPCAGWQDYVLGNVYTQSLSEIWNNSERVKYLRTIAEESFPECLQCVARDYCSRCLVRNYNESNGDMFAINRHFCKIAFLTKQIVEEELGPDLERRERLLLEKLKKTSQN